MIPSGRNVPGGIRVIQNLSNTCCPRARFNREACYRMSILVLTYISYMCYHMTRKSISIVQSVLHQNCSTLPRPLDVPPDSETWCDWAPFDGDGGQALLGTLDSAFLFAYAIAMFASGFVAERVNLRVFLALGMLFSGIANCLFGFARPYQIHSMTYFIIVQIMGGIFQTTGWPGVVTVVSNWLGKGKRGLIYGIWNSHTSIGNIVGSLIAGAFLVTDWSYSFIVPGFIMGAVGFFMYLFLVVHPNDVGIASPDRQLQQHQEQTNGYSNGYRKMRNPANYGSSDDVSSYTDDTEILIGEQEVQQRRYTERTPLRPTVAPQPDQAIGFLGACRIPGVVEYSLSLFFAKLVSYTFLYWLPLYINASSKLSPKQSAIISTLFDIGGIIGAIAAGVISDYSHMSATTCTAMLLLAVPMMFLYQTFGTASNGLNVILLVVVGILVNGPYALITTSVSADLGTHSSLEGNSKALATVTAIIDGTGSIGAAMGPLLAGLVSNNNRNWQNVFFMLMASDVLAMILLSRLVKQEVSRLLPNHIE